MGIAPLALWWEPPVGAPSGTCPARPPADCVVDGSCSRMGGLAPADSFLPPVPRGRAAGCVCLPDHREARGLGRAYGSRLSRLRLCSTLKTYGGPGRAAEAW